jgi:predicted  nucleic acid-binding Zn-ribbon protein
MLAFGIRRMPAMLRFDTLKLAKELTDAGMDPRQAETLVRGLGDMDTSELATRTDLAELKTEVADFRSELKTEVADLRSELRTGIADLRSELRTEIAGVKGEIAGVKGEIAGVKGEIAALKGDMFRFLYLQAMGIVGLTVALVKLLPG